MKTTIRTIFRLRNATALLLAAVALASCERNGAENSSPQGTVPVAVAVGAPESRAFTNDLSHHVDRILLLPFRKTAENLPDDNVNFVPDYLYAKQMDVDQFPLNAVTLNLPVQVTYQVLVVGYNRSDYNFADRNNPANRFVLGSVSAPTTLANFHLNPRSPVAVPEFFTALCEAWSGSTSQGNAFVPEAGYTLKGALNRVVSGFSLTLSDIPGLVKSVTLRAENLVNSSLALDGSPTQWQSTGDGGLRILGKKTPVAGSVSFDQYLLPTLALHKTGFFLDIEFGAVTQTYAVQVADGPVVSSDRFIFHPNQAINLTGSYALIGFGFTISYGIHLDDNQWDGLQ